MKQSLLVVLASVALLMRPHEVRAQSCYTRATAGGASTVTLVSAAEAVGSAPSNMNARENDGLDASYYQLSTFTGPASVTVATALVSGSIADNDHAPFGLTFINGTANDVTVTQVDVTSDQNHIGLFRLSPKPTTIDPASGTWNMIDKYTARWTGSIIVPAKSGQGFIADIYVSNVKQAITSVVVGGTITTSIGTFVANGFPTDLFVPDKSNKVATAVVGFVDSGAFPRTMNNATNGPPSNLIGGQPSLISARVQEFANNQSIAAGLQLTITVPAQWSAVSVASAPAPWNAAGAIIVQPTATTAGSVTISTTADIAKGNFSPIVQIQATPPVVYTKSTFLMKASLSGSDTSAGSQGTHPIRSVCDGGGTILPSASTSGQVLDAEFLSPRLNASAGSAPVESLTLVTDFDVTNSAGAVQITLDAYNFTTSAWTTLLTSTLAPGDPEATLTQTFSGSSLLDYLDTSSRMSLRYRSNTSSPMTLRIDDLTWSAQVYWVVDSEAGNDAWPSAKFPGSAMTPYRTLAKAASTLSASEQVQVIGRATAYDGNILIPAAAADTSVCRTLYQSVALNGQSARIHGSDPSTDVAFEVAGNHAKVDGFTIDNMLVALAADPNVNDAVFSNNAITLAPGGYGILLNATSSSTVSGNTIAAPASGPSPFFAIYDYSTQSSLIDNNKVRGIPAAEGIFIDSSASPTIERNIVANNYIGIHIARTTGTANLYNNTVDGNAFIGVFAENASAVSSLNNIISRNNRGWWSNVAGVVTSDYEDVYANTNAAYTNVMAGANSIAADPSFAQTSDPSLATYYQLTSSSPCVDAGSTAPGLPFVGSKPDIGAVESH